MKENTENYVLETYSDRDTHFCVYLCPFVTFIVILNILFVEIYLKHIPIT